MVPMLFSHFLNMRLLSFRMPLILPAAQGHQHSQMQQEWVCPKQWKTTGQVVSPSGPRAWLATSWPRKPQKVLGRATPLSSWRASLLLPSFPLSLASCLVPTNWWALEEIHVILVNNHLDRTVKFMRPSVFFSGFSLLFEERTPRTYLVCWNYLY